MKSKLPVDRWIRAMLYLFCSVLVFLLSASCSHRPSRLEQALVLAGNNRAELEQVLAYYSARPADSLKYRAACFLIENMPGHAYYRRNAELYPLMDSLNQTSLNRHEVYAQFDTLKNSVTVSPPVGLPDIRTLSADFLTGHIDRVFALWDETPWKEQIAFEDFCEFILPYAVSIEKRELWTDYYRSKYLPWIESYLQRPDASGISLVELCDRLNDSLKAADLMRLKLNSHMGNYPPLMNDRIRYGRCEDYMARTVFLMRSLGIPVGIDFTPQWGSYQYSHSWNVLLAGNDTCYPFEGFFLTIHDWRLHKAHTCPKIYRHTYVIQENPLLRLNEPVPALFRETDLADVSAEYFSGVDVKLKLRRPPGISSRAAYICVFDNRKWIPAHYGLLKGNRVTFTGMNRDIIYLAAFYDGNDFIAGCDPFLLDTAGRTVFIKPHPTQRTTLRLTRKFHVARVNPYMDNMLNARFQGANRPDFSDCTDLHVVRDFLRMRYNTADLTAVRPFRYIRCLGSPGSYGNMAEMEVYTQDGDTLRRLSGRVIAKDDYPWDWPTTKERAFDGDVLTYYAHPVDSGAWVGLDLGRPERIARIRYLPRNDDNNIRPGDEYELFYWEAGEWRSLGRKTGDETHVLVYEDCPVDALYLLHNHTRGKEERIFTYENGQQIWW